MLLLLLASLLCGSASTSAPTARTIVFVNPSPNQHGPQHAPHLFSTNPFPPWWQRVERDYGKYAASQPRRADGPYAELLPWLGEQAHDWEVAATANCMGDTPLVRVSPCGGQARWGGGK